MLALARLLADFRRLMATLPCPSVMAAPSPAAPPGSRATSPAESWTLFRFAMLPPDATACVIADGQQ